MSPGRGLPRANYASSSSAACLSNPLRSEHSLNNQTILFFSKPLIFNCWQLLGSDGQLAWNGGDSLIWMRLIWKCPESFHLGSWWHSLSGTQEAEVNDWSPDHSFEMIILLFVHTSDINQTNFWPGKLGDLREVIEHNRVGMDLLIQPSTHGRRSYTILSFLWAFWDGYMWS